MDRLDELTVFTAILDTGSLSAAARRLHRSAPAITRSLATLEARLGTRLIERTTRRLTPTDTGRRFAADARQALAAYAAAMHQADDAPPHGVLRITAPLIFGRRHITPVVASFLAAWPAMQADLLLADRNLDLFEEALDIALRIGPPPATGVTAHRVGEVRRIVVASPGYLAANGNRAPRPSSRATPWCTPPARRCRPNGASAMGGGTWWSGSRRGSRSTRSRRPWSLPRRARHHPRAVLPGGR